ncbi:MAG: FAD-dependent oxidoreductase [Flavobacteriales bacterium]|nr:FAD-dependent oxidoreductase [Flavobacteriales bacterium]
MSHREYDVVIVGAGAAGLAAAIRCEESGLATLVIESDKKIGGRIRNDLINGFNLEKGFQVLIDSYEKAQELLDYSKLDLKKFAPGAIIFDSNGSYTISDPLRDLSSLPSTALSRVGSFSDKFKLLRLSKELRRLRLDEIFEGTRNSTLQYLREYGFSDRIIENFFRPFFGGVFLERDLATDASMFRFVFRNFSLGNACIPAQGMSQLPEQLRNKLTKTEIRLETTVKKVNHDPSVELSDGTVIRCSKLILACNPNQILKQIDQRQEWKRTTTMYFHSADSLPKMNAKIGLDARANSSINNFARHDEVIPDCAPKGRALWSVTTRRDEHESKVQKDLAHLLRVNKDQLEFLKKYDIPYALPIVERPKLSIPSEQTQVTEHIHLAGDYLTNSSIDGALRSGQAAAKAIAETLEIIS